MGCFSFLLVRRSRLSRTGSSPVPRKHRVLSVSQEASNAGLFDRLPFEIRHLIYVYVLGGDLLHLTQTSASNEMGHHAYQLSQPCFHHYHTAGRPSPKYLLCLLKTCRQIYIEASPVIYSTNTFGIFGAHNLPEFCEFSRKIRKDCLDSITSIYINCQADDYVSSTVRVRSSPIERRGNVFLQDWKQTWEILATQMPGLRDLKVRLIRTCFPQLKLALEEDWVKPMLEVRGLRRFGFDLAQGIGSEDSTAEYNEMLEWFQNELQTSMCAPR